MHTVEPGAATRPSRRATIESWLAIPEERRAELIDGRIVYQGIPGPVHGRAQSKVAGRLSDPYDRRAGSGGLPGGWWISIEVDLDIAGLGCRPDVLGWRRDRHTALPTPNQQGVVTVAPDWICEVLSEKTAHVDMGEKRVGYHRARVEHYWLLDLFNGTLTVLQWTPAGYLVNLVAGRGNVIRAAPFDTIEIDVGLLLGDDEGEEEEADDEPGASGTTTGTP
jgi:Uma2 family endonuclease